MKEKNRGANPAHGLVQNAGGIRVGDWGCAVGDYLATRTPTRRSRWARSHKNTESARAYAPMTKQVHVYELKIVLRWTELGATTTISP